MPGAWRPAAVVSTMLLLAILAAARAQAHDSPEHVVEFLTARMKERGKTAELLWRRATEHRALNNLAAANTDLREAIALQPGYILAQADLARVEWQQGKVDRALETLNRGMAATSDIAARVPLELVRAEVRRSRGDFAGALADMEQAIAACPEPDPEWYLLRGQIQLRLGEPAAAATGLQQGFVLTGSAVLEADWIDALLDAGQARTAVGRIEPQLAESRCQSSWLLRRARARLLLGETTSARGDLHAAITEINERLNADHPEPALLLDRGYAQALLGDLESARRDLNTALKAGADEPARWRLEGILGATKPNVHPR